MKETTRRAGALVVLISAHRAHFFLVALPDFGAHHDLAVADMWWPLPIVASLTAIAPAESCLAAVSIPNGQRGRL